MNEYLAQRIVDGALDYVAVVTKHPARKEAIDAILVVKGRQDLIVN